MWSSIANKYYEGLVRDGDVVLYHPYAKPPGTVTSPDYSNPDGFLISGWGGRSWQAILDELRRYSIGINFAPVLYRKYPDGAMPPPSGFTLQGTSPSAAVLQKTGKIRFPGNEEYAKPLSLP